MANKSEIIKMQLELRITEYEEAKTKFMEALNTNPANALGWYSESMVIKQVEAQPCMRAKKVLDSCNGDVVHPDFLEHLKAELREITHDLLNNRNNLCSTGMAHNMVSEYTREGNSRARSNLESMLNYLNKSE